MVIISWRTCEELHRSTGRLRDSCPGVLDTVRRKVLGSRGCCLLVVLARHLVAHKRTAAGPGPGAGPGAGAGAGPVTAEGYSQPGSVGTRNIFK